MTAYSLGEKQAPSTQRIAVFIGGLCSHSGQSANDHALRDDFAALRSRLANADPSLRFVYFSYSAGLRLRLGIDPGRSWTGRSWDDESEPRYNSAQTTDLPVANHVAGLHWLLRELMASYPNARLDLVGFSLGGIVALAWAAEVDRSDLVLAAVHRIILISTPVGGITSLGKIAPLPGVRHALRRYQIGFGRGQVFRDLETGSPALTRLSAARGVVDIASVENSHDHLVNGRRITGQAILPEWVHTISLGRGTTVTGFLPPNQCYTADLGGWNRHLRTTHQHILRGASPEIDSTHAHIAHLVTTDGPHWRSRHAQSSNATSPVSPVDAVPERATQ